MWQFLLVALSLLPAQAAPSSAPSATEVLTKVQKYYETTKKLSADFKQTYTNVVFGKSSESHGKVFVKKPGKMRWDYKKPEPKHFISDGTTLWVYEPSNKQAFKQDLKAVVLPVALTFLFGEGDLAKDFTPSLDPGKYGGASDLVLKLVPKKPSAQFKHLWLVVDSKDFYVKESIILEASDNLNRFLFFNIKLNDQVKVEDKHFKFKPPAGVKILEPEK
ncbi:MAG: outer membrane lipoprotein chaperone LolA [Deltaproteobacteria bacterium]|nr:outer membrane lipoprotein chaperone LolA [Deltaproteobacteria bacterium]